MTNGKLPHLDHFDGKAEVEEYIRSEGIPATFIHPGVFMTNIKSQLQKVCPLSKYDVDKLCCLGD